jgi:hypothetical protein
MTPRIIAWTEGNLLIFDCPLCGKTHKKKMAKSIPPPPLQTLCEEKGDIEQRKLIVGGIL